MASDAAEGKVFQALGVMVQPAMNKFGLALVNAQTQYQLHINKAKGAVITLGQEVFRETLLLHSRPSAPLTPCLHPSIDQ